MATDARMDAAPLPCLMATLHRTPTKAGALRRVAQVLAAEAAQRVRERRRRPRPAGRVDVPRAPRDIDPRWLTAVLAASTPGVRVRSIAPGDGSTGTTTRAALRVAYDGDAGDLPHHLFVKCTSAVGQRVMLGLGGFIHGEPGFYTHVRPHLNIEAPTGYHAAVDPRSWRSVVITEDVAATRSARFWEPSTTTTRPQIEDLLAQAAAWHGALWDSPRLDEWRWLRTPADQMRLIDALLGIANRLPAGARRAHGVIPPALRNRQDDVYEALRRSMHLAAEGPHTYVHGDLHIGNTYVTGAGAVGVADWQTTLRGSWALDVGYIVTTALTVEDRRAWERDLLSHYLAHLAHAGGPAIDHAGAWQAYRRSTLYPYFAWVYTMGRSRLQPAFQPDEVSLTLIGRIAAAIDDLDSLRAVGV